VTGLSAAGETVEELLGLHRALADRTARLAPENGPRAVSIPVYGLAPGEAAFAALLALFLRRFDVPVVLHGSLESAGEPSAAVLLRELDVLPSTSTAEAERRLRSDGIAFMPVQLLSPPFAAILALRARLGTSNAAHLAAMAIDPLAMGAVRLVSVVPATPTAGLQPFISATEGDALVVTWPEGESPANLALRPRIDWLADGVLTPACESEAARRPPLAMPAAPAEAAAWIREVIARRTPAPDPVMKLAAVCIHASGAAPDITQAKAVVALQSGRLAA
jgi:anthranilate phosphoribosyltransferase